jgi:hypothetical protein
VIIRTLGKDKPELELKRMLSNLKQIEYSDCPEAFRKAWLRYVQAWERFATPSAIEQQQKRILASPTSESIGASAEVRGGFAPGAKAEVQYQATYENNAKLAESLAPADVAQAFRAVESVALKFNVDALKYP